MPSAGRWLFSRMWNLTSGLIGISSCVTDTALVERDRLDQCKDGHAFPDPQLVAGAPRYPGVERGSAHLDPDVDDRARLVAHRGNTPRQDVEDADSRGSLRRERDVAGADA